MGDRVVPRSHVVTAANLSMAGAKPDGNPVRRLGVRLVVVVLAVVVLSLVGCSGDGDAPKDGSASSASTASPVGSGPVIRVPQDHPTVQEAVDSARPGDMVLIAPGTYEESVDVEVPDITIRGVDRTQVIFDGGFKLENGIRVLDTDGVVVENLTVRNYTGNGVFWTGSDRYRGSYLTVYRNGDYGIYALDSYHGMIDNSLGSGNKESAVYVGQCFPCDTVVDGVVGEYNGVGYSGTNSGGDLYIVNSTFRFNRVGLLPTSGSYELCYPGRSTVIVGNIVHDNNYRDGPGFRDAYVNQGNGIVVFGSLDNRVERNLVYDHDRTGISVLPYLERDATDGPPPAADLERPCREVTEESIPEEPVGPVVWDATGNRIIANRVFGSGIVDLAVGYERDPMPGLALSGAGNCFSDNDVTLTAPPALQEIIPCDRPGNGADLSEGGMDFGPFVSDQPPRADPNAYRSTPVPGPQPNMPDARSAPHPRFTRPVRPDLDAIVVPDRPAE